MDAYDLDWYRESIKFQKTLILILVRAQRPQYLTAGKFFNISLENYRKVCNVTNMIDVGLKFIFYSVFTDHTFSIYISSDHIRKLVELFNSI
jgi:hypothetical protein